MMFESLVGTMVIILAALAPVGALALMGYAMLHILGFTDPSGHPSVSWRRGLVEPASVVSSLPKRSLTPASDKVDRMRGMKVA